MDSQSQTKQPFKIDSQSQNEMGKYFHPKEYKTSSLPKPGSVSDAQIVRIKNANGTYTRYQMLDGAWHNIGTTTIV